LIILTLIELGNAYDFFDERDRWQLYSKELQIKQEVLQRAMKQIKDLSDELKTRGKEVLTLRKDVKAMQQDNSRKHQVLREEEIIERAAQDPERVQATQAMTVPELKTRLLKLAQAYKAGRVRNSEFEEQIKQAYKDVEAIPKLQRELDRVQLEHKQRS
jgi:outer membrane PBP1 activator LpoA protein